MTVGEIRSMDIPDDVEIKINSPDSNFLQYLVSLIDSHVMFLFLFYFDSLALYLMIQNGMMFIHEKIFQHKYIYLLMEKLAFQSIIHIQRMNIL